MNSTLTARGESERPQSGRLAAAARTVSRVHPSAWLLALSSGLMQVLVFPKPGLYWLSWLCVAPLVYAVLRAREADAAELLEGEVFSFLAPASLLQAFFLGWVCGVVVYLGSCYWVFTVMHLYGGLSTVVSVLLLIAFALYIGLHQALFAVLLAWAARYRAGYCRRALFLAPFLWVAVELVFRTWVVGFPWDLLGTAQIDNASLSRVATYTGVYGLSFEIVLVNVAFVAVFLVRPGRRGWMLFAAAATAITLQATRWLELERLPADHSALLLQQNVGVRDWQFTEYRNLLRSLEDATRVTEGQPGKPDLVVWPESSAPFFLADQRFLATMASVAQRTNQYVVAGSVGPPRPGSATGEVYNSAALFTPEGKLAARYDKVHLVPFGEYIPFKQFLGFAQALTHEAGAFARGGSRYPLQAGPTRLGVFICYESIFPGEVRDFALRGAQVFVNISNDAWFGDSGAPAQHLNMARMRAVENQRWLVRDTNTGITVAADPLGRVVASVPVNQRTTLLAPYALIGETTFYTRYGDVFACACAIISLAGLLVRRRFRLRRARPGPI